MLKARTDVLRKALELIPARGFTDDALVEAATFTGLSRMSVGAMFPRGPVELVEYVMQTSNASVATELCAASPATPRTSPEIVKFGLSHRLQCITPFAEHWSVAIALTLNPSSLPRAMLLTAHLVDEIAFHADKALVPDNGPKWYLRRAALAGVYSAAELHLLGDTSVGKSHTKLFVKTAVDSVWCA